MSLPVILSRRPGMGAVQTASAEVSIVRRIVKLFSEAVMSLLLPAETVEKSYLSAKNILCLLFIYVYVANLRR